MSALSLLVLALATGCLTLPIIEEPLSSSTLSLIDVNLTSSPINENEIKSHHVRLVSDDETTELSEIQTERLSNDEADLETSTTLFSQRSQEDLARSSRLFEEVASTLSSLATTEKSLSHVELNTRALDDWSLTSIETVTGLHAHEPRSVTSENESEVDQDKRELPLELTTNILTSFTSTSSAVAPELYTSKVSGSTSTQKYIGLLKDQVNQEEIMDKPSQKSLPKSKLTTTKKTKLQSNDKSGEDAKESNVPVAQLDQQALDKVSNVPSDVLVLEESVEVVTDASKVLQTTMENDKKDQQESKWERKPESESEPKGELKPKRKPKRKPEPESELEPERKLAPKPKPADEVDPDSELERPKSAKPLPQGKKPSHLEEKEPDH